RVKEETLSSLRNFRSPTHNKEVLRILEIGIGSGTNFKYYPFRSTVIGVDPNANFASALAKNVKKHNIDFEKLFHIKAEDMSEISDESVDVVITTFVICSVSDPDLVLKQIARVLRKQGRYYFIEHGAFRVYRFGNFVQWLLKPMFYYFGCGCNNDRRIDNFFYNSNCFSNINLNYNELKLFGMTIPIFPHYYGIAEK
ncbi:Methyltransferase-like 7A, partial [Dinothrombium tinctorium]